MVRNRMLLAIALLATAGAVGAATYYNSCGACGNSTEDRSYNTANRLSSVDAAMGGGNTIKVGDRVKITGGDGTTGVYEKYSKYSSIRWGCVSGCGGGDSAPWFIPPVDKGLDEGVDYQPV